MDVDVHLMSVSLIGVLPMDVSLMGIHLTGYAFS